MKNNKKATALRSAITSVALAVTFGFAASTASAAVVIPLTGANVAPGIIISAQTTTNVNSGVGAIAIVPSGTYTQAFLTFDSLFSEATATVNIGSFSSLWVRDGNTLTTTSQGQVNSVLDALSTTGPTGFTIGGSGGLPVGSSLQTLTFVPEPSSALLGAIGMLALLRRKR